MKSIFIFSILFICLFICIISCEELNENEQTLFPQKFSINIPNAISSSSIKKSTTKSISGNDVYGLLRFFIHVGDQSGQMVDNIFKTIRQHHLSQTMNFTFTSNEDNRIKSVIITENQIFEEQTWQFMMTVKDNDDFALKIFWNIKPVKGIAILQPGVINQQNYENSETRIRLEYSEAENNIDQQMIVSITGFPINETDKMNKLKMKVQKKGNLIEVVGNANIPELTLIDTNHTGGYSWSFVARSNETLNIGVAQIALPVVSYPSIDQIFEIYSMYNVFVEEINIMYPGLPQHLIFAFLQNTNAPGYFVANQGFISCGVNIPVSPMGFTNDFINLSDLQPFIPNEVNIMTIEIN